MVIASGAALMPFTAGASSIISFIGKAAAVASTVQCIGGALRTASELAFPEVNDYLDNETWYEAATAGLGRYCFDGCCQLGIRHREESSQRPRKVTGKTARQVLRGLTRQERTKLNNELLKIRDPRLTTKLLKLEKASGNVTKRISAIQMQRATAAHKMDIAAALLGFTSSTVSGNVRTLALGIYEEVNQ